MIVLFLQRWIVSRGRYEVTQGRRRGRAQLRGARHRPRRCAATVVIDSLLPLLSVVIGAFTRVARPGDAVGAMDDGEHRAGPPQRAGSDDQHA